jgi:acyl-coenzyme A synthetase/AMP-(fatty) acid ligase
MEFLQSADFWIGLVKIVWINIILSGDNAVVIALAARSLPPHPQKKAVFWGSGAAVVLRAGESLTAGELRSFCIDLIAKHKAPRYIWFLSENLPRNASGKFLKREVKAALKLEDAA